MKIWITGEAGFIAHHFERLTNHEVINSLNNSYYNYFRTYPDRTGKKQIDIFDPSLKKIILQSETELIIHTAEISRVEECNKFQNQAIKTNIEGTFIIADIARSLKIPVVNISAPEEFFAKNTIYGYTKKSAQDILNIIQPNNISIVPGELYGAYKNGIINSILFNNKVWPPKLNMNIDAKKPFTYIKDFINGLDLVIKNLDSLLKQKINIAARSDYSLSDILDFYEESDFNYDYEIHPENDSLSEYVLDSNVITQFGWTIQYDLLKDFEKIKQEIRETIENDRQG